MRKQDFIKLATDCQKDEKEKYSKIPQTRYVRTLFIAIMEDEQILISEKPNLLGDAKKCMLIHERAEIAITNWYYWYNIEFINEKGEVSQNRIDDEFKLRITSSGRYENQVMFLESDNYGGRTYYQCVRPWETSIKKVWALYMQLKNVKTEGERNLISRLFMKDEAILDLEKQVEEFEFMKVLLEEEKEGYKKLLDDIKELVETRK